MTNQSFVIDGLKEGSLFVDLRQLLDIQKSRMIFIVGLLPPQSITDHGNPHRD